MNKAKLKRMTRRTEFYMLIVLLLLCVVVQIKSGGKLITLPGVFTRLNVTVLRTMVVDGMFAMCSLVVMISGGFDLSFPAIAALAYSLSTTICLNNGWCAANPLAGFALAVAIGWVLGMLNGWIISNFKLNTMIVTLGTQTFFTGISMGLLKLKEITSTLPEGMKTFGKLYIFESADPASGIRFTLSAMVLFLIALCAIVSFMLNKTMFGRALYAIGGNEVSAERAGYNVKKTTRTTFNNVVRQIRSATFVGVRIVRERATPIRHEITVFEIFDQHGLALGNLEYGSLVKNRLIRGIFGSFYNFRFPADKEVIVFLVRFLLRSFARVFRHFSFAHFHLLQESRTVHEGNIVSFLHLALHVVNLQRSLVTITIGNEPVKAVNRFFNIFY